MTDFNTTDLSAPEMQNTFKKLQRTSLATTLLMCVFIALSIGITVWVSTLGPRDSTDWAEIMFYIMIAALALCAAAILVWELLTRRNYNKVLRTFIAEGYYSTQNFLSGGNASFEIMLAGDKLTVMREGLGDYVQFDLAPVKSYTSVCSTLVRYAKNFIRDYYYAAATRGEVTNVTLTDRVNRRTKTYEYVSAGKPVKDCKNSYNIKNGIIR